MEYQIICLSLLTSKALRLIYIYIKVMLSYCMFHVDMLEHKLFLSIRCKLPLLRRCYGPNWFKAWLNKLVHYTHLHKMLTYLNKHTHNHHFYTFVIIYGSKNNNVSPNYHTNNASGPKHGKG